MTRKLFVLNYILRNACEEEIQDLNKRSFIQSGLHRLQNKENADTE